jgi:predicted DNA-binding transcriptional regulator YafY
MRRDGRASPATKVVRRAIREARVLRLQYKDRDDSLSERRVRPLAIWAFTDGWLFAAWCELRNDFRAFRMDRISSIEDAGDSFVSGPNQDLPAYFATKLMAAQVASGSGDCPR